MIKKLLIFFGCCKKLYFRLVLKIKEILNFILFLFYELYIKLYSIIVNNKFSDGTKLNNSNFKKFNSIVDKVIYINLLERKDMREMCE